MSGDRPNGAELLAIAENVLRQEILPHVDADKRLETLMVLRAIAICQREIADAGAAARETERAAAGLYGPDHPDQPTRDRAVLNRLAADIRAGQFDAAERARALHEVLLADTRRRLRIANPKYLDGVD